MAEVVEADAANTVLGDELVPHLGESIGMNRSTVRMREHEVVVIARAVAHLLFELHPPPRPEHPDCARIEVDRSPARRGLRRADLGFVPD